jgi:hypothetical protein
VRPAATGGNEDLFEREKELLGDDAALFNANDTKTGGATVEDDDDDLLGGGNDDFTSAPAQPSGNNDLDDFESSFPAIDSRNDVRPTHSDISSTIH